MHGSEMWCNHCNGHRWVFFCIEWPAKMTICSACGTPMKLVAYDPKTERTSYRRIPL